MTDAGLKFENEAGLKSKLPGTGMVVDFLVVEDGCNILIDAKGVEMSTTGRTATTARTLYSTAKRSAMKAVEQGMETLARIRASSPSHPWGTGETFLIVVTFESLYLESLRRQPRRRPPEEVRPAIPVPTGERFLHEHSRI